MISQVCTLNISDDELSRWHDDDLAPARMALIRTHVATCPACRERLAAFEEIGARLRALKPPPLDFARLMADVQAAAAASSTPVQRNSAVPHITRRSRRWLTGATGLAAVLLLSLLAGYLFANHGPSRSDITLPTATVTSGPIFSASDLPLFDSVIAMSSPSDGWAFGDRRSDFRGPAIALHFSDGHWTRVQTGVHGRITALTMLSAADGWLVGTNVYHYDGHSWREVALPHHGDDEFSAVAAVNPSSIWIGVNSSVPSVLHYDGTGWTRQSLPPPETFNESTYAITEFAMSSADEGWAVTQGSPQENTVPSYSDAVLHYIHGVWTVDRLCYLCDGLMISLATPSDGWVGGSMSIRHGSVLQGNLSEEIKPVLWRLSNGVWKDAPLPIAAKEGTSSSNVPWLPREIHMFSATGGWLIAANTPEQSLFRLQHGQWVAVSISNVPRLNGAHRYAFVSPEEFWTIGMFGITHYDHGVWGNVGG